MDGIVTTILTAILGFVSSLLLTFYRENKKLRDEKKQKEKSLENGVVCILRKHLMDEHEIWTNKGYITPKALESGLLMYKAYKGLGGNGMIDHMEEEIQALPIRD